MRPPLERQEAERLVETYSDLVLRLSYSYLNQTQDAQDICQTVFLKLLERAPDFVSSDHEKAWIIRTTANTCKDLLKSHWRRTTVAMEAASHIPAPELEEGSLSAAVNLLPPKYRAVIYPVLLRGVLLQGDRPPFGPQPGHGGHPAPAGPDPAERPIGK